MKKKRLIGLLLTVALLCVAMVAQIVSALSPDESKINPSSDVLLGVSDYYLKSMKVYKNGELAYTNTNNYIFHDDGSYDWKLFQRNIDKSASTSNYSIQKEYDDKNRLVSFKLVSDNDKDKDYSFSYMDNGSYTISNADSIPIATFDPEYNSYLDNGGNPYGWTFEYDGEGRKTKMIRTFPSTPSYEVLFDYVKDEDTGKLTKKTYTIYEGDKDPVSGTIDISYSGENTIHKETIIDDTSTTSCTSTFDKDNHLIKKELIEDAYSGQLIFEIIYSYTYNDLGIVVSESDCQKMIYGGQNYGEVTIDFEYTYDYHKREIPVIPEEIKANKTYNAAQESLNDGDDISIEMTGDLADSIKTAGAKTYEGTDSYYYYNKINKQIDDTEDLELSMNITGSDVGEIDEEEPAPLRSILIYDDKTFTHEHLVATGEDFSATVEALNNELAPVSGMIRGALVVSAPKLAAANNDGYKLNLTVPAEKLEKDKTYYLVIGRDMVTNDLDPKSTNTDIVFEFTTGEVTEPEHEHTAGKPVKENEVAATCTKEGSYDEVVYCSECNEELSRETKTVNKLSHTEEIIKGKAATCNEKGLTDGKKCSVCGEVLKAQEEIPALGHKEAAPVKENEVAATCTKEGSYDEVVYCSECNEELSRETKTVAKLPHTEEVIKGKAATCTEKGLTDGKKCSVCDEILKAQEEIPALGHDYKDGVCTRCGDKDPNYQPEVPDEPEEPATSPKLPFFVNGIVKGLDGKWAMYKKGEVDTSYTGIAHNLFGWWRVKDGYVDFDANGIYKNEFGWWKTTKGKVTFLENGVFQNEYGWWRVENSKVNFKANGIYKNEHGWWKTTNGKVTFDENGVFKNQFGWWYVKDSKVDFNFTGIASNQYGTWYIKNGKVDFTKNGKVDFDGKTYQVTFGKAKLA